mmetsp:Transcript_61590/g.198325  ORF Transcript_61590/g.198325 Transcript_61590/m.198325 type:complete len:205 (-) Transcript_61590:587-1201(-)
MTAEQVEMGTMRVRSMAHVGPHGWPIQPSSLLPTRKPSVGWWQAASRLMGPEPCSSSQRQALAWCRTTPLMTTTSSMPKPRNLSDCKGMLVLLTGPPAPSGGLPVMAGCSGAAPAPASGPGGPPPALATSTSPAGSTRTPEERLAASSSSSKYWVQVVHMTIAVIAMRMALSTSTMTLSFAFRLMTTPKSVPIRAAGTTRRQML